MIGRIITWASESHNNMKEQTHLQDSLRKTKDELFRAVGWLELDNGFFFFTDKVMFEQTCKLFGVKP